VCLQHVDGGGWRGLDLISGLCVLLGIEAIQSYHCLPPSIPLMLPIPLFLYSDHEAEDPDGQSMYAAIDTSKVRCLNESELGACRHPFKPYSRRREAEPRLDSHDDDPELLLFVPFTRVVKLKSINIIGGHAGEGTAPTKINL